MKSDRQKDALLEAGIRLFLERGYLSVGVRELAAAAGVPQGSFVNCFESKEQFALAVLDRYCDQLDERMRSTLCDPDRSPRARLDAYFDLVEAFLVGVDWRCGCLIGDFSAEMPSLSEHIRNRLGAAVEQQIACFQRSLEGLSFSEGRQRITASFLVMAWQGALLRTKVQRDASALRDFRQGFGHMLDRRPHERGDRPSPRRRRAGTFPA